MKILIVEDDQNKLSKLQAFLNEEIAFIEIAVAQSFHSGTEEALSGKHDFIILDMSIPTFDKQNGRSEGRPLPFGGRQILRHMQRRQIKTKAVVITQYEALGEGTERRSIEELDSDLLETFPENYVGIIFYNTADDRWKDQLSEVITSIRGEF